MRFIKLKKIMMTLVIISILIGCQNDDLEQSKNTISESHQKFLTSYGWKIERNHSFHFYGLIPNKGVSEMSFYQEYINDIKEFGGVNLNPYLDAPITETGYVLNNTIEDYTWIQAYVYESDGEVIGGYLVLYKQGAEPKIIPMIDKSSVENKS
jgi:hypothetical protein